MTGDDVGRQHHVTFESLRHVDEDVMECGLARELMALLECAPGASPSELSSKPPWGTSISKSSRHPS